MTRLRWMTSFSIGLGVLWAATRLAIPVAHAQSAAEATYKMKCVACHAADGSGSEVGKKLGAHDFHSADVQNMSDAALADEISKGKNKMPAYGKTLKPDEIQGLVAYVRGLSKKA